MNKQEYTFKPDLEKPRIEGKENFIYDNGHIEKIRQANCQRYWIQFREMINYYKYGRGYFKPETNVKPLEKK